MPQLTVIIPTHNVAKTLAKALQSLMQQTWHDFEVIIQDGLSSDLTIEMALSYRSDCNFPIHVFSEKDNGIYDAMNLAIGKANGDWIYFLGADDYIYASDVFEKIAIYLMDKKLDFIYGNVFSPDYGENYDGLFDLQKLKVKNICHQAIFYRKSLFNTLGKYNTKYKVLGDWDFNFRCFIHPQVHVEYVELLVAYFAPGGFGRKVVDYAFSYDKEHLQNNYIRLYRPFSFWKHRLLGFLVRIKNRIISVFFS